MARLSWPWLSEYFSEIICRSTPLAFFPAAASPRLSSVRTCASGESSFGEQETNSGRQTTHPMKKNNFRLPEKFLMMPVPEPTGTVSGTVRLERAHAVP